MKKTLKKKPKKKLIKRKKKVPAKKVPVAKARRKGVDPLHVPSAKLVVYHNGKEAVLINKALLDQQNCWENLEKIKALHEERLRLEDWMASTNPHVIAGLVKGWADIQFELQDAWGFERNSNYHRYWDIPACDCPKIDNNDAYPHGYYTISGNCKLHGRNIKRRES